MRIVQNRQVSSRRDEKFEFVMEVSVNIENKNRFFQDDLIKSIGAGIYEISVDKKGKSKVLYIGESVFVIVRCASHLYKKCRRKN